MSYELNFDKKARESLQGFQKDVSKRIFEKLRSAKENPEHFFERLAERGDYKLRVGDYRIIADINHETKRIDVTLIDHRKRVYKRI